jgi:hypothetical protein
MVMAQGVRKFALTVHIASSVGSLGAVAGFSALAITGLTSKDVEIVRAAYLAMDVTAWLVIVPLILASLLTGLIQSLGTRWGLFRHYWVLVKFLIGIFVTVVLMLQMRFVSYVADAAAKTILSSSDLRDARLSLAVHAGAGLLVLLVPLALSVYKPTGMTRYGWRKHYERHGA